MTYGDSRHNAVSALPTGNTISPMFLSRSPYFDRSWVAYVLFKRNEARTRPTRVFTSHCGISGWKVGTIIHLEHDQTQAYLGEYTIVGISYGDPMVGSAVGVVPNLNIKHCVAK